MNCESSDIAKPLYFKSWTQIEFERTLLALARTMEAEKRQTAAKATARG